MAFGVEVILRFEGGSAADYSLIPIGGEVERLLEKQRKLHREDRYAPPLGGCKMRASENLHPAVDTEMTKKQVPGQTNIIYIWSI